MNGTEYDNQQEAPRQEAYQQQIPTGPPPPPPQAPLPGRRYKSPTKAAWFSLGPGLGQVYVGYYLQGFINVVVVASLITFLSMPSSRGLEPFAGIFLAFFWVWNILDANRRAVHYNRAVDGLGGDMPPEDFQVPGTGGSMFGGVILMVLGVAFFLDLKFGISLEWIGEWWPLLLVFAGGFLVYRARQKSS